MNILMTADTIGGVWTYAIELARALDSHDVDVTLASMGATPGREQRKEAHRCRNVRLVESTFKLEWMQDPWLDVDRAGDWLLGLAAEHSPDVIHLNGYAHGALAWHAPVIVVGHSCVWSWWSAVKNTSEVPCDWHEYRRRAMAGLHSADVVVAPTRAMLDSLTEHYGALPSTNVIANGRAARQFVRGNKEPFIASAGRLWDEAKNVMLLATAAESLPWRVVIAGDIASPDGSTVDLPPGVEWLGRLSAGEIASLFSRASIYALPARYEPFGLSVLEAALSGCALVLGDIASLREVWGDAALFVSPSDEEELIDAIERLCRDTALRHRLVSRSVGRALDLSDRRMAAGYAAMYASLCADHRAAEVATCAS